VSGIAPYLVAASAAIVFGLGALHLAYTFRGPLLRPRDRELQARMETVSPVITRQSTMWKAWIGFNASHSVALLLYGAVYGYLALARADVLFGSAFLLALGLAVLLGYVALAHRYFFRVPFRAVVGATLLYGAAITARWA
jgi:hypothetical protein